jgi:hypothetical protein
MQNLSTSRTLRLLYECHNLHFVPYFRMAILQWGGFSGLDTRFLHLHEPRWDHSPH